MPRTLHDDLIGLRYACDINDRLDPHWRLERTPRGQRTAETSERIDVDRALAIAELLGCREAAIAAMRSHAETMAASSRDRLTFSARRRAEAEDLAIRERKAAESVRRTLRFVEGERT